MYNDPHVHFRLSNFAFADDIPARDTIQGALGYDEKDIGNVKEGRDLNLIMLFSQTQKGMFLDRYYWVSY